MTPEDRGEHKEYELSFLLKSDEAASEVLRVLGRAGAEIFLEGPREAIPLAYPVRKETNAVFGYVHFRAFPDAIRAVTQELRLLPPVLRFLVITPPFVKLRSRWEQAPRPKPIGTEPELPPEPARQPSSLPLSNEALEKKIEEILQ